MTYCLAVMDAPAVAGTLDEVVFARVSWWPVLLTVPLVILAFLWASRQRRRVRRALGNPELIARLVASVHPTKRAVSSLAVTAAVGLLSLALMRLQFGGQAEIVEASGIDVILAVDYSKSMLAKDVYPSRSERLEAELSRFLEDADRRGDRVGLVLFAGQARGMPVTRDVSLLELVLEHADPRTENPGGTAIGRAIQLSLAFLVDARTESEEGDDEVPPAEAEQVIVLLTDGEDNASRPEEVAAEAARLGIRIYTVGIGSRSGEPIQTFDAEGNPAGYVTDEDGNYVMTRLDEDLLKKLASETGGRYIHVEPQQFGLDEVRRALEDLSGSRRREAVRIYREEGFTFLCVPALGLLLVALALGERRRRA